MAEFRSVTPNFAVAAQLDPRDMVEARQAGFTLVINNRPDNEAPGQPMAAAIRAAAEEAGLDYVAVPVRGGPTAEQAQAVAAAIQSSQGPVLAFCRSGTRSITAWAMGRIAAGDARAEVLDRARAAGYDLSGSI